MKNWKVLAITLAVLALPLAAFAAGAEFAVGAWYVDPSGRLTFEEDTPSIGSARLSGLDEEWQGLARLKLQPPVLPGIYLQAAPLSFDSSGESAFEFSFGDVLVNAGDTVDSDFFLNIYDAALYIPIPLIKQGTMGVVSIELGAGARWIHFRGDLESTAVDGGDDGEFIETDILEDSETADALYPQGYAAIRITPHERIALEGEAWGYSYNGDKFWSLVGRLKLVIIGPMYIDGGYREDYYNFDDDELTIRDAHFRGPFAEVGLKF